MQKIEQNSHITEETWIALANDAVAPGDYMKILEHTCGCTWCAERLASVMEGGAAPEPPAYLQGEILEQAGQLGVQLTMSVKKTEKKISNQFRLLMYSLKVGLAVAVSVFLLAVSANVQELGLTGGNPSWEEKATEASLPWEEKLAEGAGAGRQEEGLLAQMNQMSQTAASWMNSFSNFLLNGGN